MHILNMTYGHLHSAGQGRLFLAAAALATLLFATSMALLGTSGASGYFYVAWVIVFLPVLFAIPQETRVPQPVRVYAGLYFAFFLLCVAHVLWWDVSDSILDYAGRFLLGLVGGFFFYHLFGYRREALFAFLVLLAGAQATVAISYAIYHGFDFHELARTGERIGGNTNPIPFSLLFITSLGLAVLALSDRLRPERKYACLALIAFAMGGGFLATTIGMNRSTTIILPLLFILLAVLTWDRLGPRWGIGMFAACLLGYLPVVLIVFQRDPMLWVVVDEAVRGTLEVDDETGSAGLRAEMLRIAWQLIREAPWLGHGLRPFSEILADSAASGNTSVAHFDHVHNEYFNNLLKMGIVGTVLFYAPIVFALTSAGRMLKSPRQRLYAITILWVTGAYLIFGMTGVFFEHAAVVTQFGVYLGMLIWLVPAAEKAQPTGRSDQAEFVASAL